ncbi:dihydropteroate synthase [Modestobacter sp. VKM Ac-2986]|uniref:dihydropteroate synthase n=1 Tax=Modestobacter sp. VKM Ac-2986 TaxID=3004140 RepID=UPI0022AB7835|nr:dihydropteroate synthase [Modestobacter sp. VKM Ac-2986]MCZ2829309.1 dihydropteroate synthase [Modestobacter sp. VKM Ac-2986]
MTAHRGAELARPGRCVVIGVLNVTPDSFSDGGRHDTVDAAVAHGLGMVAAGADYVDVGGESTRPGADRVAAEEELHRVLPVVTELARAGVSVSVDTTRSQVAAAALAAGAVLVNDVSGGLADPAMAAVVADAGVPWVLMHRRGDSRDMYAQASYRDVVAEVRRELCRRVDAALAAGVDADRVVVDPGLGFAKLPEHDLALLAGLDAVTGLGLPVLVGASRKRFLGAVLSAADGRTRTPLERDSATLATTVLAASAGAWGVRVHDVAGSADAVRVLAAVAAAAPEPASPTDLAHARRPGGLVTPVHTDDTERWRSA